jgi:eukaryotic-like serine/threonine-protein kinase
MATTVHECPDDQTIADFLAGDLSQTDRNRVEQHLDRCQECFAIVVSSAPWLPKTRRDAGRGFGIDQVLRNLAPRFQISDGPTETVDFGGALPVRAETLLRDLRIGFGGYGRYSIASLLGAGGFGVVYRGHDYWREEWVAIKVLHQVDPAAILQLKKEFRVLADLEHPNLVRLYDLVVENGNVFFTMELVDGRPLVEALRPDHASQTDNGNAEWATLHKVADWTCLVDAFRQLVMGVSALHSRRLLHRDLKPSNVLLTSEGRAVILDFGLAADMRRPADETLRRCGTPSYMAPEQLAGRGASEASDWYSVGVMLYQTLTGTLPYPEGRLSELVSSKASGTLRRPAAVTEGVPPFLDRLCMQLMETNPADRPDAEALLRTFGAQAEGGFSLQRRGSLAPHSIFVGRTQQLSRLSAAFEISRTGQLVVANVLGSSGMGKTSLVRRFLEMNGDDATIFSAKCREREAVAYKAFDGVVDDLSQFLKQLSWDQTEALLPRGIHDLVRLFPVLLQVPAVVAAPDSALQTIGHNEQRCRAFEALRELLGRLARERPVVLFIDDLQWGDQDSAALLRGILHPPNAPPILLVVAYRQEEAPAPSFRELLDALKDVDRVEEILVEALSDDETHELAVRQLGRSHPSVDAVAQESRGVPFFVDALIEHFWQGDVRKPLARGVGLSSILFESVDDLPLGARRLLEIVALAGKPINCGVAHEASSLRGGDGEQVEEILRGRKLLRRGTGGTRLEVYHERIGEAVVASLKADELPNLHHRLALALSADGEAEPEDLAIHFRAAGMVDLAAKYATEAAARWTDALAFERAADLYALAIDLTRGRHHIDYSPLILRRAEALANAGRNRESAAVHAEATALVNSTKRELSGRRLRERGRE